MGNRSYAKVLRGIMFVIAGVMGGCAWFSPGTPEDPNAVGAPTAPEVIREGYESGSDYPEENF